MKKKKYSFLQFSEERNFVHGHGSRKQSSPNFPKFWFYIKENKNIKDLRYEILFTSMTT